MQKNLIEWAKEWVLTPLFFSLVLHTGVWLFGSFIAWNLSWLGPFGHRLMFAILCLLIWVTLIAGHLEEKKTASAPTCPPPSKTKR